MKYFSPSVWIGRIMISWGIITIYTATVSRLGGCCWHKPSEWATRLAIFAGSFDIVSAFSGLLATSFYFLNGKANLAGLQWLFILTGIPAVLFDNVVWMSMPNYP
jgi:hypothetical protein